MGEYEIALHVPLTPSPKKDPDGYDFPWIDTIEDYLGERGRQCDGEEVGPDYVWLLDGSKKAMLLGLADRLSRLPGVPSGCYAAVVPAGDLDPYSESSRIERYELPLSADPDPEKK